MKNKADPEIILFSLSLGYIAREKEKMGLLDRLPLLLLNTGMWLPTWQQLQICWFPSKNWSRKLFCIQFDAVKYHSIPLSLENTKLYIYIVLLYYTYTYNIYIYTHLYVYVSISKDVETGNLHMSSKNGTCKIKLPSFLRKLNAAVVHLTVAFQWVKKKTKPISCSLFLQ